MVSTEARNTQQERRIMAEASGKRRNAHELLEAIRKAVLEELHERTYQGVTFEGVARRAGTSKTALYRRFSARSDMVIDALVTSRLGSAPAQFQGPLREDLIQLMHGVMERMGPTGVATFRGVLGEVDNETITRVATLVLSHFEEWLTDILNRARTAGELGDTPVPPIVIATIVALLRHDMLFVYGAGQQPDIEALVDNVIVPLLQTATKHNATS
ncbi:TetR/AcrR family transcriptional regulator [Timonella sp. A28]|uniref:TetR/AcrR family transcriptional regulator n=1 Tax=Timonella sp. A28 TaxID=3442640 RepID=UPI003EB83179